MRWHANVRPPAVAGLFYAGDKGALAAEVEPLLRGAAAASQVLPQALIAPHAGYVYSGAVAAAAFATLRAAAIERVVLVGPAHYVRLRGIATSTAAAFATPLGQVPVHQESVARLADLPFVSTNDEAHAPEHSLEVELPFLQTILRPFALTPLLVGDASPHEVAEALRRVWRDPATLLVVSSDLSHYQDYEAARRRDAATAAAIERREWARLGSHDACGFLPIAGLLLEAERRGLAAQRLALCNSGDTAGDRARVVGYGAWLFA